MVRRGSLPLSLFFVFPTFSSFGQTDHLRRRASGVPFSKLVICVFVFLLRCCCPTSLPRPSLLSVSMLAKRCGSIGYSTILGGTRPAYNLRPSKRPVLPGSEKCSAPPALLDSAKSAAKTVLLLNGNKPEDLAPPLSQEKAIVSARQAGILRASRRRLSRGVPSPATPSPVPSNTDQRRTYVSRNVVSKFLWLFFCPPPRPRSFRARLTRPRAHLRWFNDFLHDSEYERALSHARCSSTDGGRGRGNSDGACSTASVWSHVRSRRETYTNVLWAGDDGGSSSTRRCRNPGRGAEGPREEKGCGRGGDASRQDVGSGSGDIGRGMSIGGHGDGSGVTSDAGGCAAPAEEKGLREMRTSSKPQAGGRLPAPLWPSCGVRSLAVWQRAWASRGLQVSATTPPLGIVELSVC